MDSSSNSAEILDSLSELPDFLTTAILSLLPMTDVVTTMLLSKRWLHLWATVPCLDFGNYHHPMFRNNLHKYQEFVSGALAHWKGSKIQKLSFTFDVDDDDSHAIVDSWLLFAIEKQVEELRVSLNNDVDHREYCAPQRLYSCSSITKMSLSSCELIIDEALQWSRLKRLKIRGFNALSEDAMNRILAGAPLLEALDLGVVDVSENLNIQSTSLKNLKIGICGETLFEAELGIWAPNLLNLNICCFFYGTCLLDVPSLTKAELWFEKSLNGETNADSPPDEMFHQVSQSIRHVEKLTLSCFCIWTLLRMKQNEMVVEFPNAKSLYLRAGYGADMLRVLDMFMFPNLTMLWVEHDEEVFASLEGVEEAGLKAGISNIDVFCSRALKELLPSPSVPYLKRVWISWIMRDFSIIQAAEILLENAKLLDKMVFTAVWYDWSGEKPELLLSKSASSPTAEVIVIDCDE